MSPTPGPLVRTIVLDTEGLSRAVRRERTVTDWLSTALSDDITVLTSAATLVEVIHPKINRPALEWTLSRIVVSPVTEEIARSASALLARNRLHGHRHAIDAILCATALAADGPAAVLTSAPDDLKTLCAGGPGVVKL